MFKNNFMKTKKEELEFALSVFDKRCERLKKEYLMNVPPAIIETEFELIEKAGAMIIKANKKFNPKDN